MKKENSGPEGGLKIAARGNPMEGVYSNHRQEEGGGSGRVRFPAGKGRGKAVCSGGMPLQQNNQTHGYRGGKENGLGVLLSEDRGTPQNAYWREKSPVTHS